MLLELAKDIEKLSVSDAILTRSPTTPLRLDSIYSEISRTHLPYGLCNAAATYLATIHHNLSSGIAEKETTACREAPIFDSYPDSDDESTLSLANNLSLTITTTPRGRFVYWKGFEPTELLNDPRLIAYIPDLPF